MNPRAAARGVAKLRRIQAVTDAALSSMQVDDLLSELLDRTRDLLHTDTAAILLMDPTGRELIATAAAGLEEEVWQGVRVPVGAGFAGRIAVLGEPVLIDHVDRTTVVNEILIDKRLQSMAGVPMLAESNNVIGVLHVGTLTSRQFTDDDIELLRVVADRASLATQARQSQLDRAAALALQRSLLPARPPPVAGLDVAVRYVPGTQAGVGGDWYDLFRLPSGHIGLVIGDIAGNGLRAAVVMGRIRSALRAYAMETTDPADVMTRLDRKIQFFEPDAMATAVYAVIDPTHATVTVSLAGHPPPAIAVPAGGAHLLDVRPDLPLGAYPDAQRHAVTTEFPVGSALMLYTDGLVERRDRALADGIGRLLASIGPGSAEDLCARATKALLSDQPASDDVAILVVRRTHDGNQNPES